MFALSPRAREEYTWPREGRKPERHRRGKEGFMNAGVKIAERWRWARLAVGCTLLLAVSACSGKAAHKAPGPDESEIKGAPCNTQCCCRIEDGYYRRHSCTSDPECTASGGECLAPDTPRCRH